MNAPAWIFTLWGGYLADRYDRKKIVVICQSLQFLFVFILLIFFVLGKINIGIILISSLLIGISDSLSMPAFQSIVPSLVEKEDVSKAVALNSIQFNLSRILGPVLAGIMITSYGAAICYGANLLSFIPFFLSLYFIYPRSIHQKNIINIPRKLTPDFDDFKNIFINPNYQIPLLTVFITSLFCPLLIFCPVIIKDIFHGGARELGWAMTAFGVGGVGGGIFSSFLTNKVTGSKYFSNFLSACLGLILILVAFCTSLYLLDFFLFITGALLTMSNTASNSLLQKLSDNQTRGRIVSLFQMALHTGISFGSLITGAGSAKFGIKSILILNGFLAIIFQFIIIKRSTKKRSYERL